MIIGHAGLGLLTQYFALRTSNSNVKVRPSIPAWCTVVGAALSDVLTGSLVILGIENIRSNLSIKPLGLTLVNIDWSHSFFMTCVSAAAWATFCSYKTQPTKHIWGWSFISVVTHLLGDWLVHNEDLALYPHPANDIKYGLGLWADNPITSWFGELGVIGLGVAAASSIYGKRKLRSPAILLTTLHLMNFPGAITNPTYTLSRIFQHNHQLLRWSIGATLIAVYLLPSFYVSYVLDKDEYEGVV